MPGGTAAGHETPAWVTELAGRNRAAREKPGERKAAGVPDAGDQGQGGTLGTARGEPAR